MNPPKVSKNVLSSSPGAFLCHAWFHVKIPLGYKPIVKLERRLPAQSKAKWWTSKWLLFLFLVILYNSEGASIVEGDQRANLLLAVNIVKHHRLTFRVDDFPTMFQWK